MADGVATPLRTLEFFSGVGGLHFALQRSGVPHEVAKAFDVDAAAVATYRHNLPATQVSTANLCSIKPQELRCGGDVWLLSPPCQPYTRQGLQLAEGDRRASALEHLLSQLELDSTLLPGALLLENVVGFESSAARARLHAVLTRAGYCVREVWCSPAMLGVPNQRTRYFLLARRGAASLPAALSPELQHVSLLDPSELDAACAPGGTPLAPPRGQVDAALRDACAPLSTYLEPRGAAGLDELALPQHVLERYGAAMDLVARHSRRSLCLTKNYARYIKGTGSILCEGLADDESPPASDGTSDRSLAALQPLAPRYLAPCEIARLHGFPATFAFPPTVSRKKQFELLGNSLSVDCVAALLRFMLADAAHNESHVGSAVSGGCAALADTDALEG